MTSRLMTNDQIPMTNKAAMTNDQQQRQRPWSLVIGHWSFVGHWCLVIAALTGCTSTPTLPPPAPGMSHLVVDVKAVPKEHWHDPRANPAYAESVPLGQGERYRD